VEELHGVFSELLAVAPQEVARHVRSFSVTPSRS
jgi:hypothetical protein